MALTDEELLALRCECGDPIYPAVPPNGFTGISRGRPRSRCLRCRKRAEDKKRNERKKLKHKSPAAPPPEPIFIGVTAKTCGHQWVARTTVSMATLISGEAKLTCPECKCGRRVDVNGEHDRICVRCDKVLSKYNNGTLCFACDEIERQQWLNVTIKKFGQRRKAAA